MLQDKRNNKKNNLDDLPLCIKLIAKYNQWILLDLRLTGNSDSYLETQNMRFWLNEILEKNNITQDMLPKINQNNFFNTWFDCNRVLNIKSLKDMKRKKYEIKWLYHGFTAIDI